LHGFHFYGPDICLNALQQGQSAYVIDFLLSHLGQGGMTAYTEVRTQFLEAWNRRFTFLYLRTVNELIFISRYSLLRRLFGSRRAIRWVDSIQ
jgi:hypothetical protein